MGEPRIVFDHVWKRFRRGVFHDSLRDLVPALSRGFLRRGRAGNGAGDPTADDPRQFWALRDVSFEVVPGQTLGIIGPNGAGKSTALKLLTRILRPTRGRARLDGRVGALIEIAGGFHPDLTGRENIFLQGAIMGMRRQEIREKFDAIVAFSELESFIDTQVKRYSSGMNARLGFAIAAHLDPDVLVIDEVLAVGDFAFQRKAFGRIREMAQRNVPVVIVSHQLDRIVSLCTHAILLDHGEVRFHGPPAECVGRYVSGALARADDGDPDAPVAIHSLEVLPTEGVASGQRFEVLLRGTVRRPMPPHMSLRLELSSTERGQRLFLTGSHGGDFALPERGDFELCASLQANVPGGVYALGASLYDVLRRTEHPPRRYAMVRVHQSARSSGLVNMHPRFEMRVPGAPAVASVGR